MAAEAEEPRGSSECFLYWRNDEADNQYAKPIDLLPVVDLNARKVIHCSRQPGATPPKIGLKTNVNYHRASLETNSYLPAKHRSPMKPLDVTQPEGPNFVVTNDRVVTWDAGGPCDWVSTTARAW